MKLAKFARSHGFRAVSFGDAVMVWDADGSFITSDLNSLKEWMGY